MSRISRRDIIRALAIAPAILPARAAGSGTLDLVTDFGAVGDGVTDNSEAFKKFGHAARTLSTAGKAVRLNIPPGQYQYNAKSCFGFLFDIRELHVVGYGAAVQNTYDTSIANSNYEFPWPHIHSYLGGDYVLNNEGCLLAQTAVGDKFVQLKNSNELAAAPAGSYVLIASLNIQYMGYPHNCDRFDYARVIDVDIAKGTLTLDRSLKYAHRQEFAELYDHTYCSGPHVGRARIWNLNKYELHDVEHTLEGLTVLPILHKKHDYHDIFHAAGHRQVFTNCTIPGYGVSNIEQFEMRGCRINGHGEIDKLVGDIVIDNCEFRGGLNFQSSSVDRVSIKNSSFSDPTNLASLYTGTAKSIHIDSCKIDTLSESLPFGLNRSLVISNSVIKKWGAGRDGYSQYGDISGPLMEIDGENNTYANGVFTFQNFAASILKHQGLIYNVVPGAQINLAGPDLGLGPMITGDAGCGTVTGVGETNGHLIITTTLTYPRLPKWCANKFRIQRCGSLRIINSTGCATVTTASQADVLGKRPFEYFHLRFDTNSPRRGAFMIAGELKRLSVNVEKTAPAGSTFTLYLSSCLDAQTFADAGRLAMTIDLAASGAREFTQTQLADKTTGDSLTLTGTQLTAIPAGKWLYQNAFWSFSYDPLALPIAHRPVIDLQFDTDLGQFRRIGKSA